MYVIELKVKTRKRAEQVLEALGLFFENKIDFRVIKKGGK